MAVSGKRVQSQPKRKRAPAKTVEGRENQLINLAVDLAAKQLSEGTASAQVITHFLKLATTTQRLEKEKLINENLLLKAKTEALQDQKQRENLYANALDAMRAYRGEQASSNEADDD